MVASEGEEDGDSDGNSDKDGMETILEEAAVPVPPAPEPQGFVVPIPRRGRHRKLHHIGSCFRRPGVDYINFEVYGDKVPDEAEIDSQCKDCFGSENMFQPQAELSEVESFTSSSSSSSVGCEPGARRSKSSP